MCSVIILSTFVYGKIYQWKFFKTMEYKAKYDTWLKKSPVEASTLGDDEKVFIQEGKAYSVIEVLETDGLHAQVDLEFDAGVWWLFLPHWDSGETGEITAEFSLKQAQSNTIIYGYLVFKEDGKEILKVRATSGRPRYQYKGAHTIKARGCIPPGDDWKINTHGWYCSTPGIEGMFYHFTPDPHPTGRREFGIYQDSSAEVYPGSAGCIVVKRYGGFDKVCSLINGIRDKQSYIPLTVKYT